MYRNSDPSLDNRYFKDWLSDFEKHKDSMTEQQRKKALGRLVSRWEKMQKARQQILTWSKQPK